MAARAIPAYARTTILVWDAVSTENVYAVPVTGGYGLACRMCVPLVATILNRQHGRVASAGGKHAGVKAWVREPPLKYLDESCCTW